MWIQATLQSFYMRIFQRLFIFILNPIYEIVRCMPERIRNIIISFCFGGCFSITLIRYTLDLRTTHTEIGAIGGSFLLIIIIMSLNKKLIPINWNKGLLFCWIGCCTLMLIVSFIHPVGDGIRVLSLTMLVGFPCLYFVWGNRGDYDKLFTLMAYGVVITGSIYLLYCLFFVGVNDPYNLMGGRYVGTAGNPNPFAIICVTVLVNAVYLCVNESKKVSICLPIFGMANFFTLMSISRTSMIVVCFILFLFVSFELKRIICFNKCFLSNALKIVAVLLTFSTFAIVGYAMQSYQTEKAVSSLNNKLMEKERFVAQKEETVYVAENPDEILGESEKSLINERMNVHGKNLDQFLSGRVSVWKAYIESATLWGHDGRHFLYIESLDAYLYAHNTALEITYRSGIFAGVLFLFVEIILGIGAVRYIYGKRYLKPFHFFSGCSIIAGLLYFAVEVAIFPFSTPIVFVCFVGMAPLFVKEMDFANTRKKYADC